MNGWLRGLAQSHRQLQLVPVGAVFLDWELPRDYPELCWKTVLYILSVIGPDFTNRQFAVLAAGPLEDLLANHGDAFIDRVEAEARRNPPFALLLGGVWKNTIDNNVWERMQKVAKGGW